MIFQNTVNILILARGNQPRRYHTGGYLPALVVVPSETFLTKLRRRMNLGVVAPPSGDRNTSTFL